MSGNNGILRPRPGGHIQVASVAEEDSDVTLIRPRPGAAPRVQPAAQADDFTVMRPQQKRRHVPLTLKKVSGFSDEPIMNAAATLLSLVPQLRRLEGKVDVMLLHQQVVQQVREFWRNIEKAEVAQDSALRARYILCSLIDETVLNTTWGEHSLWSQKSLLSMFHRETYGGEKFFQILDKSLDAGRKDYDLIELIYMCLSLGFMGKLRIDPQGAVKCEKIRADVYHVLHHHRDHYKKELSVNIRSSGAARKRLHSLLPVWVYTLLLSLMAFGVFTYVLIELNESSDTVQTELASLTPKPVLKALSVNQIRPEVRQLREFLAPEIKRGVVRVNDYGTHLSVVLKAEELFSSGSTELNVAYYPIVDKVAKALEAIEQSEQGRIIVSGHTDNIAIRTTRYPSNWHLSLARAGEIVKYMSQSANLKGRLLQEGRADTEPVASNKTAEGRARNRRVVIDFFYTEGSL